MWTRLVSSVPFCGGGGGDGGGGNSDANVGVLCTQTPATACYLDSSTKALSWSTFYFLPYIYALLAHIIMYTTYRAYVHTYVRTARIVS